MAFSLHTVKTDGQCALKEGVAVEAFVIVVGQLIFVTLVYCVAYRIGYKSAHDKAITIVQQCSGPVNELLDRLHATEDEVVEEEEGKEY